ncbi:DUF2203 domain-containing protein [Ktedonospora formicarum]|uniref:DUF2203 domain-containing protein n=1 Tax=Ktedonospora formicarum TaxID=2778364 RepID=A0A8J3MU09_9CHLR|nr:DUF2203 domain-containing protein [Ktedonospora formicarum]GHO44945.1 hypothetical protein KSX_31080 [Ktedonospora formicarum]
MPHYFTHDEAQALLPHITPVLLKIQEQYQRARDLEKDLEEMQVRAMGNGHHLQSKILLVQDGLLGYIRELQESIEELQSFGCELKDPEIGLIDFLSLREGEEIYLCWRLGEEGIDYWHTLEGGFAARQLLD